MISKPLTFGELSIGDHFIGFPVDGDDSGHGGYRGGHNLFRKISKRQSDNAVAVESGTLSWMTNNMEVIKVIA